MPLIWGATIGPSSGRRHAGARRTALPAYRMVRRAANRSLTDHAGAQRPAARPGGGAVGPPLHRCAAGDDGLERPALRGGGGHGPGGEERYHRLARPGERPPAPQCRASGPAGGALDDTRPDRLPHPSGLRRQPRRRVRAAPHRRDLSGDRPRRRGHRRDGGRHPGRQRRRAAGSRTAPAGDPAAGRRNRRRDQVRLRPEPRAGSQDAAGGPAAGGRLSRDHTHLLPRCPCRRAGVRPGPGRLPGRRDRHAALHRRQRPGRRCGRLL